jgi:hypothetical protein
LHRRNPTAATLLRHRNAKRQLQKNIRNNQKSCDQSLCAKLNDLKSFSKMAKSLTGSKAPPIGMLLDPVTGIETSSTSEVARVLLDTHFPGSTEPNPKPKPYSKKTKLKVVDLEHKDVSFITKAKLIEAFSLFGPLKSAGPDDIKPIVLQHLPDKLLDNLIIL